MNDLISRQAAIDIERNATVDTNPSHFEAHQKFTQFMDDAEVSSFGRWQWANGFNTALTAVGIDLKKFPPAQPEQRWILCDEKMPEEHEWLGTKKFGTTISDEVYVTFENEKGERFCKHLSFQNGELSSCDQFHMDTWYKGSKPIAWMPLPKPFEGELKEGHWINGKCDLCGEHAPFWAMASTYHESNYCPNCGAKMKGATT